MTLRLLRPLVLGLLIAVAVVAVALRAFGPRADNASVTRLTWVATAHQLGPVSYRDPAGAISPDGRWIAYSEGRFLRVAPVGGGPILELPPGGAQIRSLSWNADSTRILADGFDGANDWGVYDRIARTRAAVLPGRHDVRQATWSPAGKLIAAIVSDRDGPAVWAFDEAGKSTRMTPPTPGITAPAWTPRGEIACIAPVDGKPRVTIPCGGAAVRTDPDLDAYGPIAFSRDGARVYVALANASGTFDLWAMPVAGGRGRRLSSFDRDSYAPSVAADGSVVFKVQSYRTTVAVAPADGGPTLPLATFQSETPSWDPTGRWIGITYGTWRRVPDDARYPDIAQDAGIIEVNPNEPAGKPARVVHDSASEDQSLCWSPNGRWIAFHSHKDQSDDVWLRSAADGGEPPRRLSFFGRGAETGWPRWSRDGRTLLFTATNRDTKRVAAFVLGIDEASGQVTQPPREVPSGASDANVFHAEWLPDGRIVAVVKEGAGRHALLTMRVDGSDTRVFHRFASEHDMPGLGVSPDGREVAFIAPADDGVFQLFWMAIGGGTPVQVTHDRTNKTQPAWSPDGRSIAFTVWSYEAQFWRIRTDD